MIHQPASQGSYKGWEKKAEQSNKNNSFKIPKPSTMVHAYNLSTRRLWLEDAEFKDCLGFKIIFCYKKRKKKGKGNIRVGIWNFPIKQGLSLASLIGKEDKLPH